MKEKKSKIILIISLVLIMIVGIFSLNASNLRVKADSGWDTDFDSGWDSGSDWGSSSYDSDWGSSSYSGGGSGSPLGIVIAVAIIILIIYLKSKETTNNVTNTVRTPIYNNISEEEIRKYLPEFNKSEFLNKAFILFKDVQNAWMNFDYDTLRNKLSDELFNTYKSQLKVLSVKKQKNIMSDFALDNIEITNVSQNEGKTTLTVELIVSFYDYVVDANNNVVRGNKSRKVTNHYELTFICSINNKNKKSNKCPNCNAPLNNNASHVCPYCKSTIVSEHYDWIMSKKQIKR